MSRADVVEDDEPANAAKTGAVVVEEDRYVETVGLLGPYSSRKRVGYC